MAHWHDGFKDIKVKLISFVGDDLARQAYEFNQFAEFNEGDKGFYSINNPEAQRIVDEIVKGKTFPKYVMEGQRLAFQIEGISRICLAQLTRERGFFCSASGDVRPLTQDFIVPKSIYRNEKWMSKIKKAQDMLEEVYIEMCEAGVPYMESRYFGLHAQTISLSYSASFSDWARSCNSRTENNFADEINYIYRLMRHEVEKRIEQLSDPLSKKLYEWLLSFSDKKQWYSRDHTYNNDFKRYNEPDGYEFSEPAHNDWRKSSWKLEMEQLLKNKPELLLPGEKEMVERWQDMERKGETLPSTYDPKFGLVAEQRIKTVDYYKKL